MTRHRPPAAHALATTGTVAVLLALTACSSSTAPAAATPSEGPLDAFYTAVFGTGDDVDEAALVAEEQQREELVAECMKAEGFDYTPSTTSTVSVVEDPAEQEGLEWGTLAYAKKYGYGAAPMLAFQEEQWAQQTSSPEPADPNEAYVNAMSAAEQDAYYAALYGASVEYDEADWDEDGNWIGEGEAPGSTWQEQGCYGAASHELGETEDAASAIWDDPVYQEVESAVSEAYENLAQDPALAQATSEWVACMAEGGYQLESPDGAIMAAYEAVNSYYSAITDGEPDEALREQLSADEIAMATADYTCQEAAGYGDAQAKAYYDVQVVIAEKYADQLAELEARYGTQAQ